MSDQDRDPELVAPSLYDRVIERFLDDLGRDARVKPQTTEVFSELLLGTQRAPSRQTLLDAVTQALASVHGKAS